MNLVTGITTPFIMIYEMYVLFVFCGLVQAAIYGYIMWRDCSRVLLPKNK